MKASDSLAEEFYSFDVSRVYVRDSFVCLACFILGRLYNAHDGGLPKPLRGVHNKQQKVVMVSGKPGSGKTTFLHFLLRCRLHAKLPIILQENSGGFLLFSNFGVHNFSMSPFPSHRARRLAIIAPNIFRVHYWHGNTEWIIDSSINHPVSIPAPIKGCLDEQDQHSLAVILLAAIPSRGNHCIRTPVLEGLEHQEIDSKLI
ncbi:hypothetical protein AZE42_12224 [Rhizopogon vesiculosus]|uniref:Uncharacterized protein n=1 Tax=Rhizopogon vesiculosus TaxID=180088 RepID=A0A1J8QXL8_9AGAM|nr:hypothetical protein AZE42_12224 [Rhizopogon vesiculosus]